MNNTNAKSSASTSRAPYAPATDLIHVPLALWEIQELAEVGDAAAIVPLIKSIIKVTLRDAEAWQKVQQMTDIKGMA